MRDNKFIAVGSCLVTVAASSVIWLSLHGGFPPRPDSQPHAAIGSAMAQQALRLLQPGGQVSVITRDTAAFANPATDIQMASFNKALKKAHIPIASVQVLQIDPLRSVEVPAGDFLELIRKTAVGSVIVSFMGPPLLSAQQYQALGQVKPAIVAFCSGNSAQKLDLNRLFNQGLLQAAVVSRPLDRFAPTKDHVHCFENLFVVLTAKDVLPGTTAPTPP